MKVYVQVSVSKIPKWTYSNKLFISNILFIRNMEMTAKVDFLPF